MNRNGYPGSWQLTVIRSTVLSIDGPYDAQPPGRSEPDIIAGWQAGWELERVQCNDAGTRGNCTASGHCNNKWYWVKYNAELEQETVNVTFVFPAVAKTSVEIHACTGPVCGGSTSYCKQWFDRTGVHNTEEFKQDHSTTFNMPTGQCQIYVQWYSSEKGGSKWPQVTLDGDKTIYL